MQGAPAHWHALRPSRWLAAAGGLVTLLAVTTVAVLDLPLALRVAVGLALVGQGVWFVWHHALRRAAPALTSLRLLGAGRIEAHDVAGRLREFSVAPGTALLGPLVVVPLVAADRKHKPRALTLILLPDAIEHESLRQLRLWLRWQLPG